MRGSLAKARHLVGVFAALLGSVGPFCAVPPATAGDRSVTIIEGVEEPPPVEVPNPVDAAPLTSLKTDNPAGLDLTILPNGNLQLGTRIAFKVTTERPGYLVIVDINADGKLTQIYPNMVSLSRTGGKVAMVNFIKPGVPVTIPNLKNPLARFIFTAELPKGNGAIVAILSDRPVQLIDLPEAPVTPRDVQASVDALQTSISSLKIASADDAGKFKPGSWSFAATPYAIQ